MAFLVKPVLKVPRVLLVALLEKPDYKV